MVRALLPAAVLAAVLSGTPLVAQDTAHVVIVATTDVHGHATAWDYVQDREAPWGLVRAATVVDSLRAAYRGAVVLVDAGDLFQGNPLATYYATVRPRLVHPIIDAMNAMRYDAAVPGNHDFNFGLEVLDKTYAQAAFPIMAANLLRADRDTAAFAPSVLVTRGGVRVGLVGFTTPGSLVWDQGRLRGRLRIERIADAAEPAVDRVRAAGAELVVAVVHSGLDDPSSYDTSGIGPENDAVALARVAHPPDVVIFGHTHGRVRDSVINGVHFAQPQPWARSVSVAHAWLVKQGTGHRVVAVRVDDVPLGDVPPERQVNQLLHDAHEEVRYWASQPLAVAEGDWSSREARARDTPFLAFINDVQRRRAHADLSAAAAYTTTVGLGPGPVRLRDVEGIYPYENTLRAVRIDGGRLRLYLEQAARYFRSWTPAGGVQLDPAVPGYDFDVVGGVSYVIDLTRPVGSRIRDLTFRGQPVTPADTFTLALSSYRQSGGGGYTMLRGLPVVYDHDEDVRTLLEEAIRQAETLRAADYATPSWRIEPAAAAAAARSLFAPTGPARDTLLVRLVVTGAMRGAFERTTLADRPAGGLALLAAYADSLAARCACPTFRLDAGGAAHGTPLTGLSQGGLAVTAFNALKLDAAAVGVADLTNFGAALGERVAASKFQWVAANAVSADPAVVSFQPWVVAERGGRSVAVIGVTPAEGDSAPVAPLTLGDPASAARTLLPQVRAARPDAVVVLGDFDGQCDTACAGEALGFAAALDSGTVDAVIGGAASSIVRGTVVAPVLAYGIGVTVVDVVRRADGRKETRVSIDTLWAARATPDTAIAHALARETDVLRRRLEEPVAALRFALAGEGDGELPIGRLMADAVRAAARSQIALVPGRSLRGGLPGGTVRLRDVYERFPEASPLVTVQLSGQQVSDLLEPVLASVPLGMYLAGITVEMDLKQRAGRRIREVRLDGGDRLDRKRSYVVALPEALLHDARAAALLASSRAPVGTTDRDALLRYIRLLRQPVEAPGAERVVYRR